jgi:hypothetical protein
VPQSGSGERISIAFNAIPARLASWEYAIGFTDGNSNGDSTT